MARSAFWGSHLKVKVKTKSCDRSALLGCRGQADPCRPGRSSPEPTPPPGPASSPVPKATENRSVILQLRLPGQQRRAQHFNGLARSSSGPPCPPPLGTERTGGTGR